MAFELFEALAALSKGDHQWYDRLSDDDKKTASPFVLNRWLTGTTDEAQLLRLNTFVNPYVFSLGQDKALLFKLMAAATTGKTTRYNWLKGPGSKKITKFRIEAIKAYYDISTREAESYLELVSNEDALQMAEELGYDKEELAKMRKEMGDGPGSSEKPSRNKAKPKR